MSLQAWDTSGFAAQLLSAGLVIRHIPRSLSGPPTTYILKLYVTGTTPRADQAIANLRRICEQELNGRYQLEIIDVLEHPQRAEDDKILATPTLIKQLPPPLRRVIGDLSDKEKVLLGLEVRPDDTYETRPRS
jgi:circadian clock protein KaiB